MDKPHVQTKISQTRDLGHSQSIKHTTVQEQGISLPQKMIIYIESPN